MLNKMIKMRNKKGFTLIELIVVLVIMAILAALAIPAMMGYVDQAKKSAYLANCRAVYVAAQAAITEEMGKGAVTGDSIPARVDAMVPEITAAQVTKTAPSGAPTADTYVYTLNNATASAATGIGTITVYKSGQAGVYLEVDYTDGSTTLLD